MTPTPPGADLSSRPGQASPHTRWVPLLVFLLGALAGGAGAQVNWADRLGYGAANKVLILHADDAGMFPGANAAAQSLLASGEIQSASVMPPLPYYGDMVRWANAHPGHDVGLHLTLNAEWSAYRWGPVFDPPSGVRRILKRRFLLWGWRPIFPRNPVASWIYRAPRTVERELRAQIDAAVHGLPARNGRPAVPAMSPPPTHLDSHMGAVFVRESHFRRYLATARAYHDDPATPSIPALTFENFAFTKRCFTNLADDQITRRIAGWIGEGLERAQRRERPWPFPRLDQYCPIKYGADVAATRQRLKDLIEQELPKGITQILLHPSDEDPLLRSSMARSQADRRVVIDRHLFDRGDPANVLIQVFAAPDVLFTTWTNMVARFNRADPCVDPGDGMPWHAPSTCP